MGTYRILLAFLFLVSIAPAQQPAQDRFKVEGVVINGLTGRPLPRVLVECRGRAVLTGPEGEFSLDDIPAGKAQITTQKPGYFPPGAKPEGYGLGPNINVGPDTGKITLKLIPEAVITGHVSGRDEEPLEGATIQAMAFFPNEGAQQLGAVHVEVRTDEDGNFRIASLTAGRYYLAVKANNVTREILGARTATRNEAYPMLVYFPGTADLAAATSLELAPGQHFDARFSLALAPAYKIAGTVIAAADRKEMSGPTIDGPMGRPLLSPDQFDAQSGAFEFRAVPAGTYTLRVNGADAQNQRMFATRRVTVSGPITNLKLPLKIGVNIAVIVRSEGVTSSRTGSCSFSLPGHGVQQSDCSEFPAAHVELVATDAPGMRFSTEWGPVRTPEDYEVRGVPPGKYRVRADPYFGGYIQSLRSGAQDLFRDELIVPEDGSVPPIEVAVRNDYGTLKVLVRGEKPRQPAMVLIVPSAQQFAQPQLLGASNAEVEHGGIVPGSYKVFAFDSLDGLDYSNPEVLAKYASRAASVTIDANNNASVAVDLIHTGDE